MSNNDWRAMEERWKTLNHGDPCPEKDENGKPCQGKAVFTPAKS